MGVIKNTRMALQASISLIWLFRTRQVGLGTELSVKHQSIQASCRGQKKEVPHHKHTADNKSEEYRPSSFFLLLSTSPLREGRFYGLASPETLLTNVTLDIWTNDYGTWTFFSQPHCTAWGILVPQSGIQPGLAVKMLSPNHWTTREFPEHF